MIVPTAWPEGGGHRQQMRRAVIAEQLAQLRRAADQEIPAHLQLSHVGAVAEAGGPQQLALPVGGIAIDAPGEEQDHAEQQERNVGRNLAIAKDALEPGVAGEQGYHRHDDREPPADRKSVV